MNYTGRTPVRQPAPELPETDIPVTLPPQLTPESPQESMVYLTSHISHYPILFDSSRRNLTAIVEFGWAPRREG